MRRTKSTKQGWAKTGKKAYTHVSGVVVRYDGNRYLWEVVGGRDDGHAYTTLWAAMSAATRTPAVWANPRRKKLGFSPMPYARLKAEYQRIAATLKTVTGEERRLTLNYLADLKRAMERAIERERIPMRKQNPASLYQDGFEAGRFDARASMLEKGRDLPHSYIFPAQWKAGYAKGYAKGKRERKLRYSKRKQNPIYRYRHRLPGERKWQTAQIGQPDMDRAIAWLEMQYAGRELTDITGIKDDDVLLAPWRPLSRKGVTRPRRVNPKTRRWIARAVKRPGALRRKLARGYVPGYRLKGKGRIPETALAKAYGVAKRRKDTRTLRQLNLARTLGGMRRKASRRRGRRAGRKAA